MRTDIMTEGLAAGATTSKKTVNQDAYAIAQNCRVPLRGVIVADGLGSHYRAEIGSSLAAASVKDALEQLECLCKIDMTRLFGEAQQCLTSYVDSHAEDLPPDLDRRNAFGTTLLSAVETGDEILIGYVGNGAIFHIRGNFNTLPASQLLPWTAVNYLNPHSVSQGGKNLLYKLLSIRSDGPEIRPSVLALKKDLDFFGDIALVCSDGIYSYDQTPMGRDDDGHIWISGEAAMSLFFETLRCFFAGREYTEAALQASLNEYLEQLRAKDLISDDCTLAVLITERALLYQRSLWDDSVQKIQE